MFEGRADEQVAPKPSSAPIRRIAPLARVFPDRKFVWVRGSGPPGLQCGSPLCVVNPRRGERGVIDVFARLNLHRPQRSAGPFPRGPSIEQTRRPFRVRFSRRLGSRRGVPRHRALFHSAYVRIVAPARWRHRLFAVVQQDVGLPVHAGLDFPEHQLAPIPVNTEDGIRRRHNTPVVRRQKMTAGQAETILLLRREVGCEETLALSEDHSAGHGYAFLSNRAIRETLLSKVTVRAMTRSAGDFQNAPLSNRVCTSAKLNREGSIGCVSMPIPFSVVCIC